MSASALEYDGGIAGSSESTDATTLQQSEMRLDEFNVKNLLDGNSNAK
jgi:hypothetical protein